MADNNTKTLPRNIRIVIGIIAVPSLLLLLMLVFTALYGDIQSIGAFEIIYSVVGVVAMYMAVTGKRLF